MDTQLRETLARQLRHSQAQAGLSAALDGFPTDLAGRQVAGYRHTAWQQVEHMRLAAEDLIAYCQNPNYEAPNWPDGYWPKTLEPPSAEVWSTSNRHLLEATEQMAALVEDPDLDLYAQVPAAEIGKRSLAVQILRRYWRCIAKFQLVPVFKLPQIGARAKFRFEIANVFFYGDNLGVGPREIAAQRRDAER